MFRFPGRRSSEDGPPTSASTSRRSKKKNQNEDEGDAAPVTAGKNKKRGNSAQLPDKLKRTRACMICSLVKEEAQFEEDGCDNCESFLHLAGTRGAMMSYTSANYEGMIAMINPYDSWVAKWQRIASMKPGVYAVNVRGEVEKWVKDEMADAGLLYTSRDKFKNEDDAEAGAAGRKKKKRTRRPRKTRPRINSNDSNANETTVASDTNDHLSEEPDETDETRQNEGDDHHNNGAPEVIDLQTIKEEPRDAPTIEDGQQSETASLVGNMPYRSGRRFSTSSSSDDSDGQKSDQGSLSP